MKYALLAVLFATVANAGIYDYFVKEVECCVERVHREHKGECDRFRGYFNTDQFVAETYGTPYCEFEFDRCWNSMPACHKG